MSLSEKIDTTSAAGRMIFRLLAVLAEFERDTVSERTAMAMRHLRECGRFTGGEAPFGYRSTASGDLEPIHEEQVIIDRVRCLHASGQQSLRWVAASLALDGHHSRNGRAFNAEQIRRILQKMDNGS